MKFFYIYFILSIFSLSLFSSYDVEIKDSRKSRHISMILNNNIRSENFRDSVEIYDTKNCEQFMEELIIYKRTNIAAEIITKFFFEDLGYQALEEIYKEHLIELQKKSRNISDSINIQNLNELNTFAIKKEYYHETCGIFFLKTERFPYISHLIINQAKFIDKQFLSVCDFRKINIDDKEVHQSHSLWNKNYFKWNPYLNNLNYDNISIIRTATALTKKGDLKLYEIRDKGDKINIAENFASELSQIFSSRLAYDLFFIQEIARRL